VTAVTPSGRLQRWVGRPAFWWMALALLAGGPLLSGLLRRLPPPLPVLDQVPPTGTGRLVVFADPACPACIAESEELVRSLSRHLRLVRPGFELEWARLGETARGDGQEAPVGRNDGPRFEALQALLRRRPERAQLRRGERAVLIDPAGRVRAFPLLRAPPERELLPAITQVVNGR
jgi:hypothetical protein